LYRIRVFSRGRDVSGPAPDPLALRRDRKDDRAQWVHLPAAGRPGPAPDWPLTRPTGREKTLWAAEWARPQAVMWERNGQAIEVALYVRTFARAEAPGAPVDARRLVCQFMAGLGISATGLRTNRWIIEHEPVEQRSPREVSDAASTPDKERFLRVVRDAG
jgi:hypothetical protein